MTAIARPIAHPTTLPATEAEPSGVLPLKVNLSAAERAAFIEEAGNHNQSASGYARFILGARKDPLLFLQLCRLRDPEFARGLMGNPTDAGRVADLEKRLMEATHQKEQTERDLADAEARAKAAESRLSECLERAEALSAHVVSLLRVQEAAQTRARAAGMEHELVSAPLLAVVKALTATPRLSRKELEAHLTADGMTAPDAAQAIQQAARLGLIHKGGDARYRLAPQAKEAEE